MPDLSNFLGASVAGYSLGKVLSALATLLVCLIAVKLIMKLLTRLLSRMHILGDGVQGVLLPAVKAIFYVLTLVITAEALGFNTSSLTALLSVLTLGVTLAAEDILGNVAGGLVILSSRPFALGDYIEAGGVSGTVREIGLNRVKLETPDGQMVLMPNKELSAPTEAVKAACMEAVEAAADVLLDPAPTVRLTNYGASAIEYTICCWCAPENYWPVYFSVNENLRDAFARHSIEMTYDHLNVHILEK